MLDGGKGEHLYKSEGEKKRAYRVRNDQEAGRPRWAGWARGREGEE